MGIARLVLFCDSGTSNHKLELPTSTELDCAYQPRCDPGQVSVRLVPLTL